MAKVTSTAAKVSVTSRVAGAALFGRSRSRFFGPAPAPTPTVNILFLRDPNYD